MLSLAPDLRSILERAIVTARDASENAARAFLAPLEIKTDRLTRPLPPEMNEWRKQLRAKARQLGGGAEENGFDLLVEEIAYEQWHRMLFARFLAENNLLIHPELGVPVTLQECAELSPTMGEPDAWQVAARFAGEILPGIFKRDDPASQVRFAREHQLALEKILDNIPTRVFHTDDGLGWVYQFWQSKKKKEVNASERKIGGADISPVTQLFTEDYMVRFLLENTLGAWWAARHPDSPLIKEWKYLRWLDDGTPAAGKFEGWQKRAAEITFMDPCCGSGHFDVAAFDLLYRMRMEEEGLSAADAADATLRDNIFGLELDERCTQIAAFALALVSWKVGGYRKNMPIPHIACSGIAVQGQLKTWTKLAGDDPMLRTTLERLYELFKNAPDLGSLINPADVPENERMFTTEYSKVEPLLETALAQSRKDDADDSVARVFGGSVQEAISAGKLLAGKYTLIATNVPYLGIRKMDDILKEYILRRYPDSKSDIATVFIERCRAFALANGTCALVTPQNWLSLSSYTNLRRSLLLRQALIHISLLGPGAFETIGGEVVKVILAIINNNTPNPSQILIGIDAHQAKSTQEKAQLLVSGLLVVTKQADQSKNPDMRITIGESSASERLETYAGGFAGLQSGDYARFGRCFWEIVFRGSDWSLQQSTVQSTIPWGGREHIFFWQNGEGEFYRFVSERLGEAGVKAWVRGTDFSNKMGVAVSSMTHLAVTLYSGELFDNNTAVILPKNEKHLPAIWAFCSSTDFNDEVRKIDKQLKVTNATLVKVPFDLEHWQHVANEIGPLPKPYSNDPTQWLFEGHPVNATDPLQVAVARLLGYRWDKQKSDSIDKHADDDGIVCLPAIAGEQPAAERLRALLADAYGDGWSPAESERLLAAVGYAGKTLEEWLRDDFFDQHCRLFHNRPFIWHIWDGRKDGFSALVNYHGLYGAKLDRLIYTYLGDWIEKQKADANAKVAGADARLVAAITLQAKLEAIKEGYVPDNKKTGFDIYVRWKTLAQQPIGWEPDLNDGVRLNIRPFVTAEVLRSKFTINWNKDRGKNPDGSDRLNDLHFTRKEKEEARRKELK